MLPEPVRTALLEIVARLNAAQVEYYVGGSVMLAMSGLDVEIGDIDIVVDPRSRGAIEQIFADRAERDSLDPWRSAWLLRAEWHGGSGRVGVDVIGGLSLQTRWGLARFPLSAGRNVEIDGVAVTIAPLSHWYHLYDVHTPQKAVQIRDMLGEEDIAEAATDLGIGDQFSPTLVVGIGNETAPEPIDNDMSTDQQSSIIQVASPTDQVFDEPGSESIDLDLLNETLEYIRPALQADGGDLVLLGTEGGKVSLQLVGACGGCPLSTMTLTSGIERIVQDRVPGVTEVVAS